MDVADRSDTPDGHPRWTLIFPMDVSDGYDAVSGTNFPDVYGNLDEVCPKIARLRHEGARHDIARTYWGIRYSNNRLAVNRL